MKNAILILMLIFMSVGAYSLSDTDTSLLAWWPMNETSGSLIDHSKGTPTYNLAATGTPNYNQKRIGTVATASIEFDGDDYFSSNDATIPAFFTSMKQQSKNLTVAFFSNSSSGISTKRHIGWNDVNTTQQGGQIHQGDAGNCLGSFGITAVSGNSSFTCATATTTTGQTYCVAGKWTPTNVSIYINGTLQASTLYSGGAMGISFDTFVVGSDAVDFDTKFLGFMAYAAIWNRSLSDSEISDFCTSGISTAGPADTTPPSINFINLTSEGANGQIILNSTIDKKQDYSNAVRTNDTTPTFVINTSENSICAVLDSNVNLNYTDTIASNILSNCTTTGSLLHTCTLPLANATRIGTFNFSIGCADLAGNQNLTSTSGKFLVNITDGQTPNVNLVFPPNGETFLSTNSTILFNWSSTDNFDTTYNCTIFIDGTTELVNNSWTNGSTGLFQKTVTGIGSHNWSVHCRDSYLNLNSTQSNSFLIEVIANGVDVYLQNLSINRTYEYQTTANISANTSNDSTVCITVFDGTNRYINTSCAINNTYLNYSILVLRQNLFNDSLGKRNLSSGSQFKIILDNRTELYKTEFNATCFGSPQNVTINFTSRNGSDNTIALPGVMLGDVLFQDKFISANLTTKKNLTFSSATTQTINVNFSRQGNKTRIGYLNFTINGFNIDTVNAFIYSENFTNTTKIDKKNSSVSVPNGVYDDFDTNKTVWKLAAGSSGTLSYTRTNSFGDDMGSINLIYIFDGVGESKLNYSDEFIDLRNVSYFHTDIEYIAICSGTSGAYARLSATDGITYVTLYSIQATGCGQDIPQGITTRSRMNVTGIRRGDGQWDIFQNGSYASTQSFPSGGVVRIVPNLAHNAGGGRGEAEMYEYRFGGVWLNRSNSGGYKNQSSEFISNTLFSAPSNIATAILKSRNQSITENHTIQYFLSVTNGSDWEEVTPEVTHSFANAGSNLRARILMNSTSNTTTPVVSYYQVEIVPTSMSSLGIDVGNDGIRDANYSVLNSTTTPVYYNGNDTGINSYITNSCNSSAICSIPILFTSGSGGIIEISAFNLSEKINPIGLNVSQHQSVTDNNFTIKYTGGTACQIEDIQFDFKGSKNITVNAHDHSGVQSENLTLTVRYSPFNVTFPRGIGSFLIEVSNTPSQNGSLTEKTISPFGQIIEDWENRSVGIFNVTSNAYDENIYVQEYLNKSLNNSCLTIESGPFSNATNTSVLGNSTFVNLTNNFLIPNLTGKKIYNFVNVTNCNVSNNIYFEPVFCFNSWCQSCVYTDGYNIPYEADKCLS